MIACDVVCYPYLTSYHTILCASANASIYTSYCKTYSTSVIHFYRLCVFLDRTYEYRNWLIYHMILFPVTLKGEIRNYERRKVYLLHVLRNARYGWGTYIRYAISHWQLSVTLKTFYDILFYCFCCFSHLHLCHFPIHSLLTLHNHLLFWVFASFYKKRIMTT